VLGIPLDRCGHVVHLQLSRVDPRALSMPMLECGGRSDSRVVIQLLRRRDGASQKRLWLGLCGAIIERGVVGSGDTKYVFDANDKGT
jgi:hypothetical protein